MPNSRHVYGPVGRLAKAPVDLLVCFAVVEEMQFFAPHRPRRRGLPESLPCQVWLTGIGRRNAAHNIREAIATVQPKRVITAGFAGGLNPNLRNGMVLYEDDDADFSEDLEDLGAIKARFYCHRRVATTAEEKLALWKSTGADAVEMESSVIRTICREFGIPSVTIRVISDDARLDLPLDFNELMTSEDRINFLKLIGAVLRRPSRIPKLIEFQRQTVEAARHLGAVLEELLRVERC
jgi:adenosylhomocysteine nucleosidase